MKVALRELVDAVAVFVGRLALLGGALAALVWTFCVVSDWYFCHGRWMRCTKCGERTKAKAR